MPLSLGAHTQRDGEQERKDHDETDLQRALPRNEVQYGRRSYQEADSRQDEDKADDHVDAAFAVELQITMVGLLHLLRRGEDHLEEWLGILFLFFSFLFFISAVQNDGQILESHVQNLPS